MRQNRSHTRWLSMVAPLVLLVAAFAYGQDEDDDADFGLQGRISLADENALIKGQSDTDWSYASMNSLVLAGDSIWADDSGAIEVELPGDVFVRLADGSRLDIAALSPRAVVKAWTGSFYVQRMQESVGDFALETPVCSVQINPDTLVRVDVLDDGATTVSVRWGRAEVLAGVGDAVELGASQRTYIDPGLQPSAVERFDRSIEDDFDEWNGNRTRDLAGVTAPASSGIPATMTSAPSSSGAPRPVGFSDLNQYGVWVEIDGEMYWKPVNAPNFIPYRDGSWSYVPSQGYVWVGYHPFAYMTTHYGYWSYDPHHGWVWYYTPYYAPARVASVRYGDYFIWSPIDRYGHTYYHGSDYFDVGGIYFSFGFSSYAFYGHVTSGYAPCYSLYSYHVHHYHPVHIEYWNIHHHHHHHHGHHYDHHHLYNDYDYGHHKPNHRPVAVQRPSNTPILPPRDYTPKRVMRGRSLSNQAVYASKRAELLQKRTRTSFTPTDVVQRPSRRTDSNIATRQAKVRTTRLSRVDATPSRVTRSFPNAGGIPQDGLNRKTRPGTTTITPGGRTTRTGETNTRRGITTTPTKPSNTVRGTDSSRTTRGTVSTGPGLNRPSGDTTQRPTRIQTPQRGSTSTTPRGGTNTGQTGDRSGTTDTSRPTRQPAPRSEATSPRASGTRFEVLPGTRSTRVQAPSAPSTRGSSGPSVSTRSTRVQAPAPPSNSYVPKAPSRGYSNPPTTAGRNYSAPAPSSGQRYSSPAPSVSTRPSAPSRSYSAPSVSAPSSRGGSSYSAPSISSRSSSSSGSGGGSSRGGGRVR